MQVTAIARVTLSLSMIEVCALSEVLAYALGRGGEDINSSSQKTAQEFIELSHKITRPEEVL